MLFLHALLFSLLGMSALAIPVPTDHVPGTGPGGLAAAGLLTAGVADVAKHTLEKKLNGLWQEIPLVSEHRSFYLTRY